MPTTRRRTDPKPVARKGNLRNAAVLTLSQVSKFVNLPVAQDVIDGSWAIKRLASGQIDTSISPSRTSNSNKPLPPHPKNITNAQAISKLEAYNQVCQVEDNAWSELIAAYNSQQAQVVAALATPAEKEPKEIELDDQWRQGMQLVKEGVGGGAEADDEM
ncbi:unnamed protein product, partial [Rhizoctonia solani]